MDCPFCHSKIPDGAVFCPPCGKLLPDRDEPTDFAYAAFISYRHLPRDTEVARQVQRAIETYQLPRGVAAEQQDSEGGAAQPGRLRPGKTLGKCFRDEDELAASPSLPDSIQRALAQSRTLVIICSPDTQESRWVQREIETFAALRGRDRIICVLADGDPARSIPNILKTRLIPDAHGIMRDMPAEPLAADLRPEVKAKRKAERLRIIAAVASCNFDDLRQRERARKQKRITISMTAVLSLVTLIGALSYQLARTSEEALIVESKQLASLAQEQLARGERLQAIQTAVNALPAAEDDRSRPLIPEAKQALQDALLVDPDPNHAWRPLFTIDADEEIIALAPDPHGRWIATLDATGTLLISHFLTGATMWSLSLEPFEANRESFVQGNWMLKATNNDRLLVARKGDPGHVICIDAVARKTLWARGALVNAVVASEDGASVGIFQFTDSTSTERTGLIVAVHDGATGEPVGVDGLFFEGHLPLPLRSPLQVNNAGDVALLAMPGTVAELHPGIPSPSRPSVFRYSDLNKALPSDLFWQGTFFATASYSFPDDNGGTIDIPYEIAAWDLNSDPDAPLWRTETIYHPSLDGIPGDLAGFTGLPAIHDIAPFRQNENVTEGLVYSVGSTVAIRSRDDGDEIYTEDFSRSVIDAYVFQFSKDGGALAIALSDGTLTARFPGYPFPAFGGALDLRIPYRIKEATFVEPDAEFLSIPATTILVAQSPDYPNRVFAFFFDARLSREPQDHSLDDLLDYAHRLLDPGRILQNRPADTDAPLYSQPLIP